MEKALGREVGNMTLTEDNLRELRGEAA